MSYIHEALKKAQVEKEDQSPRYDGVITKTEKKSGIGWKRMVFWGAPLCLILLLAALTFLWFYPEKKPAVSPPPKIEKPVPREQPPEKLPEKDIQSLFLTARNLQKNGRLQEAETWYKKTVEADPGYVPALNNLGVVYLHGEKFSEARDSFEKAIRLNPGYVDPYYNLACLFARTGEPEKALPYLRKAVSMSPQAKQWAMNDPDLANLRSIPAFQEMIR